MAVTLTVAELSEAIRLGSSDREKAQATRLLSSVTAYVEKVAPDAPSAIQNEATILIAGYRYDAPTASAGPRYANAMRNSGAGELLLPWRVHRGGAV